MSDSGTAQWIEAFASSDRVVSLEAARLAELGASSASLLHELRQPLFAVKAIAQMGAAGLPGAYERILEQVEHMEAMLLAYGPTPHREVELVDLSEVVRGAVDLAAARTRGSAARVVLELSREPTVVEVAAVSVRQVVLNLLHNALDAVEAAGGHQVVLRTRRVESFVEIEVSDDGPGVEEARRDRIFDPFVTSKAHGTGLGLYISRQLMLAIGGDLVLLPSSGGAVFVCRLPHKAAP